MRSKNFWRHIADSIVPNGENRFEENNVDDNSTVEATNVMAL